MSDKRLVNRLVNYWDFLCKDAKVDMPNIASFSSRMIADISNFCCEIKIVANSDASVQYQFIKAGDAIIDLLGYDPTFKVVDDTFLQIQGGKIITLVTELLKESQYTAPIICEDAIVIDAQAIRYRSCALPFSNTANAGVTHIIIGISWGAF